MPPLSSLIVCASAVASTLPLSYFMSLALCFFYTPILQVNATSRPDVLVWVSGGNYRANMKGGTDTSQRATTRARRCSLSRTGMARKVSITIMFGASDEYSTPTVLAPQQVSWVLLRHLARVENNFEREQATEHIIVLQ